MLRPPQTRFLRYRRGTLGRESAPDELCVETAHGWIITPLERLEGVRGDRRERRAECRTGTVV